MKRIWVVVALLIVIICLCFTEVYYALSVTNNTEQLINESTHYFQNGEKITAIDKMEQVQILWCDNSTILDIFLSHHSIDDISLSITSAKKYLEINNDDYYIIECEKIIEQLNNLKDEELPFLENIL